jgi:predicted flap endonuclease-1-like 5' DNA nuclease
MLTVTGLLCRLWRCTTRSGCSPAGQAEPADDAASGDPSSDDLTVIRGVGNSSQNRLYAAGITSFAGLARASPDEVRESLGTLARGAKVEDWIKQAGDLAKKRRH